MSLKKNTELAALRRDLRAIDDELIDTVCRRLEVVRKIGAVKKAANLPVLDVQQETLNKELNLRVAAGRAPLELIDGLTELLATWSKQIQIEQ